MSGEFGMIGCGTVDLVCEGRRVVSTGQSSQDRERFGFPIDRRVDCL